MPDSERPSERDLLLERPLPSSPDIERELLGSILLDNSLIAQGIELLKPDDFYVMSHRLVFIAMTALFERGSEITPVLVAEEMRRDNSLESSGGMLLLSNLSHGLPHTTTLEHHARIIKGKAILRQVAKAGNKMTAEALEDDELPEIVLEHSQKAVFDISLEHTPKSFSPIEVITHRSLDKAYAIQQSGKALTGITTGFHDLDALTLGWQKSDLILIAARPSMGKTSLTLSLAINAAKTGAYVAFFSLEMPEDQIAMRALCGEARMDSRKYSSGYLNDDDWDILGDAHRTLAPLRLSIDDTAAISVLQMKAKLMRLESETKQLDLICIDRIEMMSSSNRKQDDFQRITELSGSLKTLARELQKPIIVDCQLNRNPDNRTDHRPMLADLRQSGALEQDADQVAFIYRQDKYRPANEPRDHVAEIILAKNRNGPCDTVYLRWEESYARFDNLATQHQPKTPKDIAM